MANWVHCNKCFVQLQKNRDVNFFLTECGHIACEKCSEQIRGSSACIVCRKPTKLVRLCKDMDPSVRCFFSPFESQLKKCIEIYSFQNFHKESFISNYVKKYEYAKQQCMKQYTINNKLAQEKKMMQSIIRKSRGQDGPVSSTPLGKNISFCASSLSSITPQKPFKLGSNDSRSHPSLFTPMKSVPGFAQRKSASKYMDQSDSSHGISPLQTVPNVGRLAGSVPVHRYPLGPMSSLRELQMGKRLRRE